MNIEDSWTRLNRKFADDLQRHIRCAGADRNVYATHAAVREAVGDTDVGLVVHIARATDAGFEIVEVWRSKQAFDDLNREFWPQAAAKIRGAEEMEPSPG